MLFDCFVRFDCFLTPSASPCLFFTSVSFTVFLERKILERLQGKDMQEFHSSLGYRHLQESVEHFGASHNFTQLLPDLSGGMDPDDAFSSVPYEKGYLFLRFLENSVGGPDVFEPFLKSYVQSFAKKTVTSEEFLEAFKGSFPDVSASIDFGAWLRTPGMPTAVEELTVPKLALPAYALADRWSTYNDGREVTLIHP